MADPLQQHPKIRPLMAFPINTGEEKSICMRDPEGFSDATLALNYATYYLVTLMDGSRDVRDIQADFMRSTGTLIPTEQIQDLIKKLGDVLFLDDRAFRSHRTSIETQYREAGTRAPAHCGAAYPESKEELAAFLKGYFDSLDPSGPRGPDVSGIIVPHIDIRQAGSSYAAAYALLRDRPVRRAIILGTAHSDIGPDRYAVCPKDFDTPLGPVPCDQQGIKTIQDAAARDWTRGLLGHRTEHSIEFQVVFLRYLFPDREITIIPVLCNSLAHLLDSPQGPMQDPEVRAFVEALRHFVQDHASDTILIAGADLSHTGPKFGGPRPLTETDLVHLETHDRRLIAHAEKGDPEGFFGEIQKEKDDHNVCGVPNVYAFLKIFEGRKGRLLDYGQFFESPTASAVSYASLVF